MFILPSQLFKISMFCGSGTFTALNSVSIIFLTEVTYDTSLVIINCYFTIFLLRLVMLGFASAINETS
jgi:hypothetical protein